MISNFLILALLASIVKLMMEDSILLILMTMEMVSMLSYFSILSLNPEIFAYTSCMITMLTVMVSESVMSLALFISLMRSSGKEKVLSFTMK